MPVVSRVSLAAADRSPGKAKEITITNGKGQLSKEEVGRVTHKAEQHKAENEIQRESMTAENSPEVHVFLVKSSLQEDSLRGKTSGSPDVARAQPAGRQGMRASEEGNGAILLPCLL